MSEDITYGVNKLETFESSFMAFPFGFEGVNYNIASGVKGGLAYAKVTPPNERLTAATIRVIERSKGMGPSGDEILAILKTG